MKLVISPSHHSVHNIIVATGKTSLTSALAQQHILITAFPDNGTLPTYGNTFMTSKKENVFGKANNST